MATLSKYLQKILQQKFRQASDDKKQSLAKEYQSYMNGYKSALSEIAGLIEGFELLQQEEEPTQEEIFPLL